MSQSTSSPLRQVLEGSLYVSFRFAEYAGFDKAGGDLSAEIEGLRKDLDGFKAGPVSAIKLAAALPAPGEELERTPIGSADKALKAYHDRFTAFEAQIDDLAKIKTIAATTEARTKHQKMVGDLRVSAGGLLKDLPTAEAAAASAKQIRADHALIASFGSKAIDWKAKVVDPDDGEVTKLSRRLKAIESEHAKVLASGAPLTEAQRKSMPATRTEFDDRCQRYADAYAEKKLVQQRIADLTVQLHDVLVEDADPNLIHAGATATDVARIKESRAKIAAAFGYASNLADLRDMPGRIALLRTNLGNLQQKIAARETLRDDLTARLRKLVPDKAAPGQIIADATKDEVADVVALANQIATRLAKADATTESLLGLNADLANLAAMKCAAEDVVGKRFSGLDRARQAVLRDADDPVLPANSSKAQADRFNAQKALVTKAADKLRGDLSAPNIAETRGAVDKLSALVLTIRNETDAARKPYDDVGPAARAGLRKLIRVGDYERLHLPASFPSIVAMQTHDTDIATSIAAGDWGAATAAADRLAAALVEAEAAVAELVAFIDAAKGPRLQPGSLIDTMKGVAATADLNQVKTALEAAYDAQCMLTREQWMVYLDIAGRNTRGSGASDHYTLFNDAFMTRHASCSVALDINTLLKRMFESVPPYEQVHATVVVDGYNCHRYWDSSDDASAGWLQVNDPKRYQDLLTLWQTMKDGMIGKVKRAQEQHGRISR